MLALSDDQLRAIMVAAGSLGPENALYSSSAWRPGSSSAAEHFTDTDLDRAVRSALQGFIQNSAA